jgi:hypothetical protein
MNSKAIAFLSGAAFWLLAAPPGGFAQDAILPQGDPRLRNEAQREEMHDQRLKQQGQGENYRIEGEPAPHGSTEGTVKPETKPGFERQDTGLSDPTVNPGQAAGARTIQGMVVRLQDGGYVIRDHRGREISLFVDGETTGNTELSAGDYIETQVTAQGRAIKIIKKD